MSGSGKSCFAKALGHETGRPTLVLDVGALYGSLVGATEQNVRQALKVADAMAPCILYTDELGKGLSGVVPQDLRDSAALRQHVAAELGRVQEQYGNIVHLMSAYDSRRKADDAQPFARGVNSFQLMNDGSRWWILTIFWQGETPDNPIPAKFLNK